MLREPKDFKLFFESYFESVFRFAQKYTREDAIAQDIAQDTFIRLYERRKDFDALEKAKSFVYLTAKNLCLDHLKHVRIHSEYATDFLKETEEVETDFLYEMTYQETLRMVRQAIDTLPTQTRRIILLGLEGKNNNEIAEQLQISVNTVKSLKKSAYNTLRTRLKDSAFLILLSLLG